MEEDSSLSCWLNELRYRTESYEPQFRQSIGSELSLLFCKPRDEMRKDSPTSVYMHLWECTTSQQPPSKINFAEERPVSTVFHECVEEEFTRPVKVEKVEFYLTKDVLDWITNLWYSSEEEDDFEEEILQNCSEYDQQHTNAGLSSRPDKFPLSGNGVELRRSETISNRREHAQTIHETSNTRKCFTADGPYKLRADNKTKLKVENGRVEVKEHKIEFWSNGHEILTEMAEGDVMIDKQITYRTKDGVRVVTFKVPLSKQEPPSVIDSRNFLRKFLRRRSDKHLLEKKGILKNENVFGNKLAVLKEKFGQAVPPFVKTIMNYIELEENIRTEHIYRISGNMAVIQKIRLQIDEHNFRILEKHAKETEVLTGTLKLFYRELVDPILPYKDFEKLKLLDKMAEGEEKSRQVVETIDKIESPYRENLKELINHLLKIEESNSHNKMTLQSLAIVWGPSVIWYQQEKCPDYHPIDFSMLANRIVELIFTSHRTVRTDRQPAEPEPPPVREDKIARSVSDDGGSKASVASKVGGIFGLKRAESKEVLSGSSWSLTSFGSESKRVNENPFYGYSFDALPRRDNESVILEMIRLIENKPDARDLYITSFSKDYMSKFRKKITRNKPDISKMEPLDLAIILVKILRELQDKLIPEKIFLDYCDNYERLNSDQRRQFVEEKLRNLHEDRKFAMEKIMEHLFRIFEYQTNPVPITNVWLPVFCGTTHINDQALTFTKLLFDSYGKKLSKTPATNIQDKTPNKPFEYRVKFYVETEDAGSLKTTFSESSSESKVPSGKDNVKSSYSNAQLNSIADSLEKNVPHLNKYSKWKSTIKKT